MPIDQRYAINDFTSVIANANITFKQERDAARLAKLDAQRRLDAVVGTGLEDSNEYIARDDLRTATQQVERWDKRVNAASSGLFRYTREEMGDMKFALKYQDLMQAAYAADRVSFD